MDKYTKRKNVTPKCFKQKSVSKFHPEICWLNLLVIKRDSNCVGERIIIPVKKNGIQKEALIPTVWPVPVPGGWWAVPGSLAPNVSYSWQISLAGLLVNETMEGSVMLYLWSTCSVATPRHSSNSRLWVSFAFSSSYRKWHNTGVSKGKVDAGGLGG